MVSSSHAFRASSSEVLAVRWSDVDLGAGTVDINGAVVPVRGAGVVRQAHAKSASSHLVKTLESGSVSLLRERWDAITALGIVPEMVFPSATGTLRDPSNFHRQWRTAMKAIGFEWVHPHVLRKSAASWIADAHGLAAASA
ncbi:tyrosine-type recombinase/integrase [Micrococcus sp. 140720015-1]